MEDIQNHRDYRNIDIDQVGVKGISYPITVLDKDMGEQQTVALINMYVNLPRYYKGTHMSRFVEILNEHSRRISLQNFTVILKEMKERLTAERQDGNKVSLFYQKSRSRDRSRRAYGIQMHLQGHPG